MLVLGRTRKGDAWDTFCETMGTGVRYAALELVAGGYRLPRVGSMFTEGVNLVLKACELCGCGICGCGRGIGQATAAYDDDDGNNDGTTRK